MNTHNELHVVIGASGAAGSAVVHELVARGKRVRAVTRSGWAKGSIGVESVKGDASDPASAREVCRGAAVVYNCANAPYDQWPEKFPPILAGIIAGAASAGAKLVFADNLYMYGPVSGPMTEDLPHLATGPKGRTRAQMAETLLEAHHSGKVRATIGRASDYYGPGAINSAAGEIVFGAALAGKAANVVGDVDAPHTYTFNRDFARGLVTLGEREEALGEVWHIPNAETITTRQFLNMVYEEAGQPLKFRAAPRFMVAALGLFIPMMREIKEMLYEFEEPFVVDHSKYERAFGDFTPTPHREAIRETVAWFRARTQ